MSKIIIEKVNESFIKLHTDPGIQQELSEFFSFRAPNYQYSPLYKNKVWDGYIRLYNKRTKQLPAGLIRHVDIFAKDRKYTLEGYQYVADNYALVDARSLSVDLKLTNRGSPITPYDHQIIAITKAIRYKRLIIESSTSSGKSLIAYVICRYLLQKGYKGLLIVPTTGLVEQMYGDFIDYSSENGWNTEINVQKIYAGQDKNLDKPLRISTWQSLANIEDKDWFKQFNFVIGDEVHTFTAKSLIEIMSKLVNCNYRIGMTGTVQDGEVPRLTLEGYFGPISKIATNKEMIDRKISADLLIYCLILKYKPIETDKIVLMNYHEELEFLTSHKIRNRFISNLALSLKGNTLITFQFVEKHGKLLYDILSKSGRKIYYIHGQTPTEEREQVRKIAESESGVIILASYGVFQAGVSIKNLHSIIFASPSKSKIRVLQTIGRGLRISDTKNLCKIYDIADDLRVGDNINYTLMHYVERMKLYQREYFKTKIYNINIGESCD